MRSNLFAFFTAAALSSVALAQTATVTELGQVSVVRGLVTMSLGSSVATVQVDTPIFDGARFVTSSSGGATLKFSNGCTLELKQNEWVMIDSTRDCPDLIASIQSTVERGAGAEMLFAKDALPLVGAALLAGAVVKLPNPEITPRPR